MDILLRILQQPATVRSTAAALAVTAWGTDFAAGKELDAGCGVVDLAGRPVARREVGGGVIGFVLGVEIGDVAGAEVEEGG